MSRDLLHAEVPWIDPIEAASRLVGLPGLCVLDSAMPHPGLGRYSYVAADPFGTFTARGTQAFWNGDLLPNEPLQALRDILALYRIDKLPGLPPIQGGAIGAFAYEFGWALENRMPPARSLGDAIHLACHDVVLAFDHEARRCWLISSGFPVTEPARRAARARARLDAFTERLRCPPPLQLRGAPEIAWRPTQSRDAYGANVEKVKAYIRAGDIYQANIAQRFVASMPAGASAWDLYRVLRAANPAPFAAFLDCGSRQILSSSPELFLRAEGRAVETRPIKGTARRGADPAADRAAAQALLASRKDRAENVMIVDLLRNDLSRVCEPASVAVPRLCDLETYAGLHHLVSSVTGRLRDGIDALDLLAASFPGGSITGAPKLRAMEIIAEIEGVSRGVYCGSIGALGFDGDMALNIAIRTIVVDGGALELRVGGGITMLSEPDVEYEETLTKALRIFDAFAPRRREAVA